ncbi:MAG: MFS transporter [Fibrobacteraceae bacterium]|nr:MFS transporter [Fibrobacteraceae bacterium]
MKLWKCANAFPYFASVFCASFVQMGLFIFFLRWISFSYEGASFFWRSLLLQVALFLPAVFMMPLAGYLAGRYHKGKVMGWTSLGMFASLISISVTFHVGAPWVAFGLTSLFGIFHALYNPAKYGAIKEIFGEKYLAGANAVQVSIYVLGILCVSCLTMGVNPNEYSQVAYWILPYIYTFTAFLGTIISFFVKTGKNTSLKFRSPLRVFSATWSHPIMRLSILGIAFYWGVTQLFLLISQDFTGQQQDSIFRPALILTAFGYLIGAWVAARSSKNFVETGLIPFSAIVSAILMFILPIVPSEWLRCLLYPILGGLVGSSFVILRTVIQHFTRPDTSGRIHAVAEMIQMGLLTTLVGIQCLLLTFTKLQVHQIFFFIAILFTICFWITLKNTPQAMLRMGLRFLFAFVFRYRLKVVGVQNIPDNGPVLLVGSHYSFIDWAVLQMASPRPLRMASNRDKANSWFLSWLQKTKFIIPIFRRNPEPAMEVIHSALLNGEAVVIFPEGEVSKTPHISRFSIDYSKAIQGTNAIIVPFYIQGLWGGPYSHFSDSIMLGPASTRIVSVGFGPCIPSSTTEEDIRMHLRDLAIDTWDMAIKNYRTLVPTWLVAMRRRRFKPILLDPQGDHVSGFAMIFYVRLFSKVMKKMVRKNSRIGLLLPSSREGALGLMSILATGKTSVNLNYTSPYDVVTGCIHRTNITHVVTTRSFLDKLIHKTAAYQQLANHAQLIFLDDLEKSFPVFKNLYTLFMTIFCPRILLEKLWFQVGKITDPAVILFSSGSEGEPKGIVLSQKNIIANTQQIDAVIRLRNGDVMMAELPMFHSFGLTATIFMPMLDAVPMVLCPDPTDVKTLARSCAEFKATILMGTPTFLRAFSVNRWVHPMCLDYIRFVVAGAEKLRQEMRESFRLKFGKDIFEAYGCTETSPVATMNAPNVLLDDYLTMERCNDTTSVGLPVPGSRIVIADPETNEILPPGEEGMVLIGGPHVMEGYLDDPERTKAAIVEKNGHRWYKTGDKGKITSEGFLVLLDRYSRFAKLGGEMISLTAVEARITETKLLEGVEFITVAVPDSVKGERIVLLYVGGTMDSDDILRALRKSGIPPLMLPGSVFKVESLPKLGSGKWDFTNLKKLANELYSKK